MFFLSDPKSSQHQKVLLYMIVHTYLYKFLWLLLTLKCKKVHNCSKKKEYIYIYNGCVLKIDCMSSLPFYCSLKNRMECKNT